MNIISTRDISREGDSGHICEEASLVERFGIYSVIVCHKEIGYDNKKSIDTLIVTTNEQEARKVFRSI